MNIARSAFFGIIAIGVGSVAIAASHANVEGAVKARKAHMQLNGFNAFGVLNGMAKGDMEFDAGAAQAAADRLAAMSQADWTGYFPEGSSSADAETRALPAIWEDPEGFQAAKQALADAAAAMAEAAGTQEGVQANMAAVGGACGGCHEKFRQPSN